MASDEGAVGLERDDRMSEFKDTLPMNLMLLKRFGRRLRLSRSTWLLQTERSIRKSSEEFKEDRNQQAFMEKWK